MRRAAILVPLVVVLLAAPAAAAGMLIPRDGSPPIAVKSHRVEAVVTDGLAKTTLRQTFVNPHGRMLEAIYIFPLPEGAALTDVAMEVGGQRLEGLLAERKRARKIYNDIVRQKRDPALVEMIGKSKFRLSVFPVMPGEDTVVEISWVQHVPLAHGKFTYVYPLAVEGKAAKTEQDLTVTVRMESSVPFTGVEASGAGMQVVRQGPGRALASMEKSGAALDKDIVVTGTVEAAKPNLTVTTCRDKKGDGWFLAVITPPPPREGDLIPRDVTLVIDTSGSMLSDGKIKQAKTSALWLLDHLRPEDRVNVLRFSSDVQGFAPAPVEATKENLLALKKFVRGFAATGGTALGHALKSALDVPEAEGRVRTVVLLTDGRPTIGETNQASLVEIAKAGGGKGLRIYPFGVGKDVDSGLLRGIASAGRGRAEIFRPGGEIVTRMTSFLTRTASPVISDIELSVDGPAVYDIYPRPLPDVYLGEQAAIVGRYREGGHGTVVVSATVGGKKRSLSTTLDFRAEAGGSSSVKQLFAIEKLDFLEEALRIRLGLADDAYYAALDRGAYSTDKEIVAEMISLSLEHGVQCAYTSFLVLLPEDRRMLDPRDEVAIKEALGRARTAAREKSGEPEPVAKAGEGKPGDPTIRDAKVSDHNETDNDLPFEESLGKKGRDFISDAPFEGPSTGAAIGIGGGAGGAFGGRGGHRNLKAMGGGKATENTVDLALEWLKNHIHADGYWDADGFRTQCKTNECDGPGAATADVGVTSLALLAYLGAGETHKHGRFKKVVKSALRYLKQIQDAEGCFGPRTAGDTMWQHAVGALAMSEAYALTASPLFKQSSQTAIDFLLAARTPGGGWSATHRGKEMDYAVTFWALCALKSAKAGGLKVHPEAFGDCLAWLDRVTNEYGEVTGAKTGGPLPATAHAKTAASILLRIFCGEDPRKSETMGKTVEWCLKSLPTAGDPGMGEVGYLHCSTLGMFQVGGSAWKTWNGSMKDVVVDSQEKEGDEKGSWDPKAVHAKGVGRVGTTALMAMCMQVYYRYARVYGTGR